jgi:hypothetical protein
MNSEATRDLAKIIAGGPTDCDCCRRPDCRDARSEHIADGLIRLIDERIALGRAGEHNPPSDDVKPASIQCLPGDALLCCMGSGCGVVPHRRWPGRAQETWRCSECGEPRSGPKAAEPVPGVVAVGDTFLRLTSDTETWFDIGDLVTVSDTGLLSDPLRVRVDGVTRSAYVRSDRLVKSGDWQRVPAGYVLPTAIEWHAATVRLIEARRLMKADPRTGTDGIDACIDAMARMAGMVPA